MSGHQTVKTSVKQIKSQALETAQALAVPPFWLSDWLLNILDKPSSFLVTDESYQLSASELDKFNAGIEKMRQGIPLAYLTGHQEFWSLNFRVNEHTLIPRPDTEVVIEQVLNWIRAHTPFHHQPPNRLLDLGTGSGCIAISLAHELNTVDKTNNWQIVALDNSEDALEIARQNAVTNQVEVEFLLSDWYDALNAETSQLFDVIVSNPPYIDEADEHLTRLKAEPMTALSAPSHGLADIMLIIEQAPIYLRVGGLLAIEHGFDQGGKVRRIFLDKGFDCVRTIQDYGANDRVTLGRLKDD